jgi:hypothetical protein
MKANTFINTSFLLGAMLLFSCCSKEIIEPLNQSIAGVEVVFLDAESAFEYQRDNSRYIQEQIQQIDVSIVLEKDVSDQSLEEVCQLYLDNLQVHTLDWTERETGNFKEHLEEVFATIQSKTPVVLPDTLYLIKTSGKETIGNGAMYTIAKSITLPKINTRTAGLGFVAEEVRSVLTHELFHIYSNTHLDRRAALYDVIGFYPIDLDLGADKKRIIANPDADYSWAIELEREGEPIEAILLTYSKYEKWEGNKSTLGLKAGKGYLDYGLFEVENVDGVYQLKNGLQPLNMDNVEASFRAKIGNNTDYIWAVEEIIADTYPFIFTPKEEASDRDEEILEELERLLR